MNYCAICLLREVPKGQYACLNCQYHASSLPKATLPKDTLVEGVKHDAGKLQYSLLSIPALEELIKVMGFGAGKYGRGNWKKGLKYSRVVDAAYRHLGEYVKGNKLDDETKLPHLAHLMCNAMFLLHYELTKTGEDDLK